METKVLAKAVEKVNDFYKSNAALIFFMTATTIFSLLQVILYSLNMMQVNGHNIEWAQNTHHLWSSWILLGAAIVGCYSGFIGGIMLFRGSLSFLYWQNIATGLAVITQSIASMWFGAFVSFYFIVANFVRYYAWKHGWIEKWDLNESTVLAIGLITLLILMLLLNSISLIWGPEMYAASAWMTPKNYQFDATGAALNISATIFLMFKNRWAFVLYALAKVFTIWNYADAGLIVPIVQMMLFWIMDFTGFIGWSIKPEANKNEEKINELEQVDAQ